MLYFRGSYIRDELIAHLLEARNMAAATDVVISGCSAGGSLITYSLFQIIHPLITYKQVWQCI